MIFQLAFVKSKIRNRVRFQQEANIIQLPANVDSTHSVWRIPNLYPRTAGNPFSLSPKGQRILIVEGYIRYEW